MKVVVGEGGIEARNVVIFVVCLAIWLVTSFAAKQPWGLVLLAHLAYSSAMFVISDAARAVFVWVAFFPS